MPELSETIEGNVNKIYVYNIFFGVAFFVPVMVLFWQENGLSFQQIMILQSFFAFSIVLLEVPTGRFSDRVGRRRTLSLAGLFMGLSMAVYGLSSSFAFFLLAEFIFAIGSALLSGTDCAIIYESLKELGKEADYNKVMGHAMYLRMISLALTTFLGGFVGVISFRLAFLLSAPFVLCMGVIGTTFVEPTHFRNCAPQQPILKILKKNVLGDERVFWIMVYAAFIAAGVQGGFWLYQPYLLMSGLTVAALGVLFSSFNLFAAFCSKFSHKFKDFFGRRYAFILMAVFTASSYLLMGRYIFALSFVFIYLHQFVRANYNILTSEYLNELVDSDMRATIHSIQGLSSKIVIGVILPLIGFAADRYGVATTLEWLGIGSLIASALVIAIMISRKII